MNYELESLFLCAVSIDGWLFRQKGWYCVTSVYIWEHSPASWRLWPPSSGSVEYQFSYSTQKRGLRLAKLVLNRHWWGWSHVVGKCFWVTNHTERLCMRLCLASTESGENLDFAEYPSNTKRMSVSAIKTCNRVFSELVLNLWPRVSGDWRLWLGLCRGARKLHLRIIIFLRYFSHGFDRIWETSFFWRVYIELHSVIKTPVHAQHNTRK